MREINGDINCSNETSIKGKIIMHLRQVDRRRWTCCSLLPVFAAQSRSKDMFDRHKVWTNISWNRPHKTWTKDKISTYMLKWRTAAGNFELVWLCGHCLIINRSFKACGSSWLRFTHLFQGRLTVSENSVVAILIFCLIHHIHDGSA